MSRPPPAKKPEAEIPAEKAPEEELLAVDTFRKLPDHGGPVSDTLLREIFEQYKTAQTNRLQSNDFRRVLETQRQVDGVEDPLPAGFVRSLFDAWAKDGGISEARFIYGYSTYLRQRVIWLSQWKAAQKLQTKVDVDKDLVQILCEEVGVYEDMRIEHFMDFCDKFAREIGEVPPPPGFPLHVFRSFLAGEGVKIPETSKSSAAEGGSGVDHAEPQKPAPPSLSKDAWPPLMELYAAKWLKWLEDWLINREQIGNAVQKITDAALATQADASPEDPAALGITDKTDEQALSTWQVNVDRSRGDRLGLALRKRPKFFEVQLVEDSGLMASWNSQFPIKAVQEGDRIIDVNGETEMESINAELGRQAILIINIGRDVSKRRFIMNNFTFQVNRSRNEPLGAEVALEQEQTIEIRSVARTGVAHFWNGSQPLRALRAGDRIMEVNGKTEAYDITDELTQQRLFNMTVSRKETNRWGVNLDAIDASLGLKTHILHVDVIEVTALRRHGIFADWNAKASDQGLKAVAVGDQIVEVNGKSATVDIYAELSKNKMLEVLFLRQIQPWKVSIVKPVGAAAGRAGIRKHLGIQIHANHSDAIEIISIEPGALASVWNEEHPEETMKIGDRIMHVNGKTTLNEAKTEILQARTLDMLVLRRALPWLVFLDGSQGDPLGADVKTRQEFAVEVLEIFPGSILSIWNFTNPAKAVRTGDRIAEVNGANKWRDIDAALKQKAQFSITFERNEEVRWPAQLDRASGAALGIEVRVKRKSKLVVSEVFKEGVIADWNKLHASKRVRVGYLVTEVNEEVSVAEMQEELSRPQVLTISVSKEEPAPPSRAQSDVDLADLPADINASLEQAEAKVLFDRFDRGEKGFWSDVDLSHIFRLLWQRDGMSIPPRAFAKEAMFRTREDLRAAALGVKAAVQHPTRLEPDEVVNGFSRLARRRHDLLRRWREARGRQVYKCPHCAGQFKVSPHPSGMELAEPVLRPDEMYSAGAPKSVTPKMPILSEVAALHEGVARAVAQGSNTFMLPPGIARPVLAGRLLVSAVASGLPRGAAGLLANQKELEVAANWIEATVPELPRRWIRVDSPTIKLSSGKVSFDRKGGTIFFSTADVFWKKIEEKRVYVDEIDLVVCACSHPDLPLVQEVQPGAPLSLMGGLPRVISLLDAASEVHRALHGYLDSIVGAKEDLEKATAHLGKLEAIGRNNRDLVGSEVKQLESAVEDLLGAAGRYPPSAQPVPVSIKEAGMSLAALQGHVDVQMYPPQKIYPDYTLPGYRRVAPPLGGASQPSSPHRNADDPLGAVAASRSAAPSPAAGARASTPPTGGGVRVGTPAAGGGGVRAGNRFAIPPPGSARGSTPPPGGGVRVGTPPPGGGVRVGTSPPGGGVRVGAPALGSSVRGATPPGGGIRVGTPPPGGGVRVGNRGGTPPPSNVARAGNAAGGASGARQLSPPPRNLGDAI